MSSRTFLIPKQEIQHKTWMTSLDVSELAGSYSSFSVKGKSDHILFPFRTQLYTGQRTSEHSSKLRFFSFTPEDPIVFHTHPADTGGPFPSPEDLFNIILQNPAFFTNKHSHGKQLISIIYTNKLIWVIQINPDYIPFLLTDILDENPKSKIQKNTPVRFLGRQTTFIKDSLSYFEKLNRSLMMPIIKLSPHDFITHKNLKEYKKLLKHIFIIHTFSIDSSKVSFTHYN